MERCVWTQEVEVYLSRLTFATLPGHTRDVEEKLGRLRDLVAQAGGTHVRVLRAHFASLGAPDLVFEQEVPDLQTLEQEIGDVVTRTAFQTLSHEISQLLARTPKREVYEVL
jgi:NTP pyrophosphatase (non-canonical NTP hydrolase)